MRIAFAVALLFLLSIVSAQSYLNAVANSIVVVNGDCSADRQDTKKCTEGFSGAAPAQIDTHLPVSRSGIKCDPWGRVDGIIEEAAKQTGVNPFLLCGLIRAESGFMPKARSGAGAQGYTQLMPATAASACGLTGADILDPEKNIFCGARYLKLQLNRFKDPRLALAAYNAGPGRVKSCNCVPNIPETRKYVSKVMGYYAKYSSGRPVA